MEKIIKDFPAYKITDDGKIYSRFKPKTGKIIDSWREINPIYDKSCGYMIVTLSKGNGEKRKNKRIHRLLMEAFVPNPNNYSQINHKNGNKLNNSLSNLEWCSPKQNSNHAVKIGLYKPIFEKTRKPVIQLTKDLVFIKEFSSIHEAGRQTNIAWQNIWKVCDGKRKTAGNYVWKYKKSVTTIS